MSNKLNNSTTNKLNKLITKRFVIRKSLIGTNTIITFTTKKGKQITYNHDKVYSIMKDNLNKLNCFEKYGSYTSSTNIPKVLRDKKLV